jgi:catechol 2,3-dioxygenase-like lactoylglutathione lyase family enzyme
MESLNMQITAQATWIMLCTTQFNATSGFFLDLLGLPVVEEGVPKVDSQFTRYAQFRLPNGTVLELVEPAEAYRHLYAGPMLSISVENLAQARKQLETQGIEFVAPVFRDGAGSAWTYFRAPDGHVHQLQEPGG